MITKLENYKGVIIFYLLLIIIMFCLQNRNQKIDMQKDINNNNISVNA